MLQSISELDKNQMLKEVVCMSGLATDTLIPFATPFLELCYKVDRHANFKDRALYDTNGKKILNFSPKGLKRLSNGVVKKSFTLKRTL